MKKYIFTFLFLPALVYCQNNDSFFIKRISDEIMVNGQAYSNLNYLCKSIGHRLTGSKEYYRAVIWGRELLMRSGVDSVLMQDCKVVNWKRGKGDFATITTINNVRINKKLEMLALGNSLAGKVNDAVIIALENFDELEKRKEEVKNKVVFFNHAFDQKLIETFKAYGDCGKYRYSGPAKVAKYGAIGCVIRSLSGGTDNYAHTGLMMYNDSFPKIPCAALGLRDADYLWQECKKNEVKISFQTHGFFMKDTIAPNVIGVMKGSEFPNEIITVGGHLDSWDVGEGAHDDGAGIVQTVEIARVFKELNYKPKRTIHFVLFASEENGLVGGKKYAQEAFENNEKLVFALESDAGGFTPHGFTIKCNKEVLSKMQEFQKLLLPYHCFQITAGGGGPDINALNEKLGTPVAELHPDSQRYFDVHHTKNDVFENVNKRELHLGAVNMAGLIYLVDKYAL